jgi:uncharacterized Zn finger protein
MVANVLSGERQLDCRGRGNGNAVSHATVSPALSGGTHTRSSAWALGDPPSAIARLLRTGGNTKLLIEIALDEGDIDRALRLLKGMVKQDIHGYSYNNSYGYYGFGDIALQVARAAEESRPREAIELYRQQAERLIALRGRQNYALACKDLVSMRALYEQLGEPESWATSITAVREQNRNLPALKDELANAGL